MFFLYPIFRLESELSMSLDSKSADKELKAVTPEKSKAYVTTFTKMLVTTSTSNNLPVIKNQKWSYIP